MNIMEKLRMSYYEATRRDPDYCGFCKCIPCQCDGFGNFSVESDGQEPEISEDVYEGRGQVHVPSAEYLQRSAQRHAARMARGPRSL